MENITNDDYVYTKNLIDAYINGLITFPEFLEVAPTTIDSTVLSECPKITKIYGGIENDKWWLSEK